MVPICDNLEGRQSGKSLNQNHHYQISRILENMSAIDVVGSEKGEEIIINSLGSEEGENCLEGTGSEGGDDSHETGGEEGEENPDLQRERQDVLREAIQSELEPRAEVLRYDVFGSLLVWSSLMF